MTHVGKNLIVLFCLFRYTYKKYTHVGKFRYITKYMNKLGRILHIGKYLIVLFCLFYKTLLIIIIIL